MPEPTTFSGRRWKLFDDPKANDTTKPGKPVAQRLLIPVCGSLRSGCLVTTCDSLIEIQPVINLTPAVRKPPCAKRPKVHLVTGTDFLLQPSTMRAKDFEHSRISCLVVCASIRVVGAFLATSTSETVRISWENLALAAWKFFRRDFVREHRHFIHRIRGGRHSFWLPPIRASQRMSPWKVGQVLLDIYGCSRGLGIPSGHPESINLQTANICSFAVALFSAVSVQPSLEFVQIPNTHQHEGHHHWRRLGRKSVPRFCPLSLTTW